VASLPLPLVGSASLDWSDDAAAESALSVGAIFGDGLVWCCLVTLTLVASFPLVGSGIVSSDSAAESVALSALSVGIGAILVLG